MQSEPPFAIWVPQDSLANSSIKRSCLGQMSPLVQQTLAGWRRGGRPGVPTCRADAMVDDIARARIQNRAQRGQRAAFEVPWSGGNRPRALQKWRPKETFSLGRMYLSSPRAKQNTLSSFLASEWTADNGKRSKTDAEKEDQMSGKGSIESPGRIDTSQDPVYRLFWVAAGTATSHWLLGPNAFIHWSVPELSACPHIARQTRLLSSDSQRGAGQPHQWGLEGGGGVPCRDLYLGESAPIRRFFHGEELVKDECWLFEGSE